MKKNDKNLLLIGVAVIGILMYTGYIDFSGFMGAVIPEGGDETVNTLDFILTDQWAGSGMSSKTIKLYQSNVLKETLTTGSDGSIETTYSYATGEVIDALIDCGSNERWDRIVVPNHDPNKVEASDPTPIYVLGSTHPTVTDLVSDESGTAIADAGKLNFTAKGASELITYSGFVSTVGTGLLNSDADPLDDYTPQVILYITLSDTTNHLNNGFDGSFMNGASMVYYVVVPVTEVTKYAEGNSLVHDGTFAISFELDLAAASGTGDTVQIDLYEADDWVYYKTNLAHAPYATSLCESTISLDNT